jgi:hypothetical protein
MARTLGVGRLLVRGLRMRVAGCRQVHRRRIRVAGCHQVHRLRTAMSTVRGSRVFCLMYRCPFTLSLPTNALDNDGHVYADTYIGRPGGPHTLQNVVFFFMSFLSLPRHLKYPFFFCCSTPCRGPRLRSKCVRLLPFFRTSLRSTLFCVSTYEPFLLRTALTRTSSSCPLPPAIRFSPPSILQNSTPHIIHAQCMTKRQGRQRGEAVVPHHMQCDDDILRPIWNLAAALFWKSRSDGGEEVGHRKNFVVTFSWHFLPPFFLPQRNNDSCRAAELREATCRNTPLYRRRNEISATKRNKHHVVGLEGLHPLSYRVVVTTRLRNHGATVFQKLRMHSSTVL